MGGAIVGSCDVRPIGLTTTTRTSRRREAPTGLAGLLVGSFNVHSGVGDCVVGCVDAPKVGTRHDRYVTACRTAAERSNGGARRCSLDSRNPTLGAGIWRRHCPRPRRRCATGHGASAKHVRPPNCSASWRTWSILSNAPKPAAAMACSRSTTSSS